MPPVGSLTIAMALIAIGMAGRGVTMLVSGASMGIVLTVFAGIGGVLAARDLSGLRFRAREIA